MIDHLADAHGVVLRRELVRAGVDDSTISKLRRRGVLVRLRQGVDALGERWRAADPRERHLMLAHGTWRLYDERVALSHVSGALSMGAPAHDLDLSRAHLTSLYGRGDRIRVDDVRKRGRCDVGKRGHRVSAS